jgi:hypothetical protein
MLSSAGRSKIKFFMSALNQIKKIPRTGLWRRFVFDTPRHDWPEDRRLNIFWSLPNLSRNDSRSMLGLNCWLYITEGWSWGRFCLHRLRWWNNARPERWFRCLKTSGGSNSSLRLINFNQNQLCAHSSHEGNWLVSSDADRSSVFLAICRGQKYLRLPALSAPVEIHDDWGSLYRNREYVR